MPLPCLKPRRSSKVCPAPNSSLDVDLVEVRKGRLLRIQHINPRLRNKHVPHSKHGKTQAPPLELHVPRVSFYGNKCVVTDAATQNSNHVKKAGSGPSPNNNRVPAHNSNVARCVKSNHFPSNLSKEQKRMLFKMGVRSVSALKNIVLFFFHGVGGSSDIWQTQINYFSSLGFEIVAPDLIGHGMSEVPLKKRAYHFREILADIIAIFDRYCKKKNLVIGHSYGCAFTTVLARERARRVWRLIMISGGGPIPLAPEIGIFAFPLWFVSCIRPCLDQVFEKSAFKKKQKNEMLKRASFNIPSFVLHYVINGQDWPEGDEVYHSWISVPTLLINGRDDNFATLDDAKLMKATIHGSKLEIVDEASHMVMLEAPDKVNKLILDFICSRGSHKLPDVKESAEEGHESPMRVTQACSYSGSGGDGSGKLIHPLYLPQQKHQHHHHHLLQGVRSGTPTRSPSPKIMLTKPDILNDSHTPVMMSPEESPNLTPLPEVGMYEPAYDNMAPWQKLSKVENGSSYDNASYESDESSEEYYYYKDQYGNHHYVSAKEYARQFPNCHTPPSESRASDIDMDVSTVDIPAFEDISLDQSTPMDETLTEEDSNSDYNSVNGYPVQLSANYPVDFNNDVSPRYMVSREGRYSNSQCESMEENVVYESPGNAEEINDNPSPVFSIPELQFCEECIRNHNTESTTNCEKCIELNMVPLEYKTHQTNSCTRRQSVTLALGRQRSDSLDYLGQEQLIIITCYDPAEEEKISISSSVDDTRGGPRHRSKDQATNQNATRHNQRSGFKESGETVRKKSPSLLTLNEQREECTPRSVPAKKGKPHKEDLFRSLHSELLAKVNKRNSLNESGMIPEIEKKKPDANVPHGSEPTSDEGIVIRKNSFLESKKLMEQHFAKSAFKMPALPSSRGSSPCVGPPNKRPPKPLGPKPQRRNHSPGQLRQQPSEVSMAESSPSFLQSKRTIHEHFSKVGLGSPMTRPYSSPNLSSCRTGSDINGASPQRERKPESSSSPALTKTLTKSEETLTPDRKKSVDESSIPRRLSVSEWAQKHIRRVTELASPEGSMVYEETPKSSNSVSCSTTSESDSPVSSSLSVRDWAERHLKKIAVSVSATSSPSRTKPEPGPEPEPEPEVKENISPKRSPMKEKSENKTSRSEISLSLSNWAEKHLQIVAGKMPPSSPVSVQNDKKLLRVSPEEERSVPEAGTPLTLDDWAKRHLQRIAETSKPIENKKGVIDPDTKKTSDHGTTEKENVSLEAREPKPLSLTEWAERHVRRTTELNISSPKASQVKLEDSESSKDISVVRTPEKIAQKIGKASSSSTLNDWAARHVRRIAEQKLVADTSKEETGVESERSNHIKKEQLSTTDVSVNSPKSGSFSVHSDIVDTLTEPKNKNASTVRDAGAPDVSKKHSNEDKDMKTQDKCALDVLTSYPNTNPNPPSAGSSETGISIDRSQNKRKFLETEKASIEENKNGNSAVCDNVNDIDVSTSYPNTNPNPPCSESSETGISIDRSQNKRKFLETEKGSIEENKNGNSAVCDNVNDIDVSTSYPNTNPNPPSSGSSETGISIDRSQNKRKFLETEKGSIKENENGNSADLKDICAPCQSQVTEESSRLIKQAQNEGHSSKQPDEISDVNIDDLFIGAAKYINDEEMAENNRGLIVCTPTTLQATPDRKYLLHRTALNKSPLNEGCNLRREERATEAGENNAPMIRNDDGSEKIKTEKDRSQNVSVLGVKKKDKELTSSGDSNCSSTLFEAGVSGLGTGGGDLQFTLSHETVIDSTSLEDLQRTFCRQRRSSFSALPASQLEAHLPSEHGQDSNNNNNNNDNHNSKNTDNTGQQEAISDVRLSEQTIDDNSNLVASTSVPTESSKYPVDKVQITDEKHTGSGCQPDDISGPTDNENNRILSDSTLGTGTDTDTQALTNISNGMAYTNTTRTTSPN